MSDPKPFLSQAQQEQLRREAKFYAELCELLTRANIRADYAFPPDVCANPKRTVRELDWSRLPGAPRN